MSELLSNVLAPELAAGLPGQSLPVIQGRPRWVVKRAADALAPMPEIPYVLRGLITAGSVSIFYGPPGVKKTWALLSLAVCVASGLPWLDFGCDPRKVLMIDEESGEHRMLRRLGEALRGEGLGPETSIASVSLAGFKLDDPDDTELLATLIESEGAGLVIIDALADTMTGDENSKQDTLPVFTALRKIAERTNAAIILIHHANKSGGYRGSTAISGAVDLLVQVTSETGSNVVTFTAEKSRDELPTSWAAAATWIKEEENGDRFIMRPVEVEKNVQFNRAEDYVMRFLKENGPTARSAIVGAADVCSDRAAERAIYSLASKKKIFRNNPDSRGRGIEAVYELSGGASLDLPF